MSRFKNRDKKNRTQTTAEVDETSPELDETETELDEAVEGDTAIEESAVEETAPEPLFDVAPAFDRHAFVLPGEAVAEETPAFLTSADETEEPFTSGDAVIVADEGLEQAIAAEQAAIARTQELFAEPAPDQFTVGRAIDEMLVYLESDQYKAGGNNVEGYDRHLASVGII